MSPTAKDISRAERKVRLTPLGLLVRIAWPAMLVLMPGMVLAMALTGVFKKEVMFGVAGLIFVALLLHGLALDWFIRRELRRARTWALSEAIIYGGKWYGLADADGTPHPHSPPIDQLSSEILATAERRQVLYNPQKPDRVYCVQKPMQIVRIET